MNTSVRKILICAQVRRILDGFPGINVWEDIERSHEPGFDVKIKSEKQETVEKFLKAANVTWDDLDIKVLWF